MDGSEDLNQLFLSDETILERVDEYTLYCKYLGFEPLLRTRYNSFIRPDDSNPSFSIFYSVKDDREYFWKDSGSGESGDIFKLIRIRFGLKTTTDVYELIDRDFNLGYTDGSAADVSLSKIVLNNPPIDSPTVDIRIHSRPFNHADLQFWIGFGITLKTLNLFRVKAVKYLWMHEFQPTPTIPSSMCFAYEILGKTKLYQPHSKLYKFRNDYTERCLEGFGLLQYKSDLLIITKSLKDVMTLYELGYEAVSPRGEHTLIPEQFMGHFRKKYKRILILFDNDMKHNGHLYVEPKIYVPVETGEKDISDFRRRYGRQNALNLLKLITTQ